ncbi:MAG: hypothetical protein IJ719_16240 [Clostridia bacterium]|nr:hypothetical protein [Clostridia bacterium]
MLKNEFHEGIGKAYIEYSGGDVVFIIVQDKKADFLTRSQDMRNGSSDHGHADGSVSDSNGTGKN